MKNITNMLVLFTVFLLIVKKQENIFIQNLTIKFHIQTKLSNSFKMFNKKLMQIFDKNN